MKQVATHTLPVVLLAALTSVTPLAVDMYLPAMPAIARDLATGIEKIEVTVAIFLLCFALGQLVGGTLSDRIGRRKTALGGLLLFALANLALFTAASLESLYLFRAFQAFGGGIAIVNSSAVVRDLFHGKEAAKAFSAIASITMIAPMIAPALGALVIAWLEWRYIFLFLGIYALAVALVLALRLPETGTRTRTPVLAAYRRVLTHREAQGYILALSLSFSGMFVFIAKSSYVYMEYFAVPAAWFPLLFGANVFMMILLTRLNILWVRRSDPAVLMRRGIRIQSAAGLGLLALSFSPSLGGIFAALVLYVGILGIIFGNGVACALEHFRHDSGIANSVIGVTEFTIAGAVGFAASALHTQSLTPVFALMASTSLLAWLALRLTRR